MYKKLLQENTNNINIQIFRYTIVGGFAFVVDFLILFILTEYLKIYYLNAAAISFLIGLLVNYYISINWIFTQRNFNSQLMEFMIYGFIGLIGLGINELFIWLLTEKMALYYLLSKVISTIFVFLWNFFIRKFILFY